MKQHQIAILIGPSACGKSRFASILAQKAKEQGIRSVVISSDAIRKSLLIEDVTQMASQMTEVSEQAFKMLFATLESHTTFPVNTELVIVDTTGLDERFRSQVLEVAQRNRYAASAYIFDLPKEDIKAFAELRGGNGDFYVTMKQVDRLRREVLPAIKRSEYAHVTTFRTPEKVNEYLDAVHFVNQQNVINLQDDEKFAVVGDIHECADEFKKIVDRLIENQVDHLFLLGDYIDKNNKTEEIIKAIVDCHSKFKSVNIVRANHERYVYKRYTGVLDENSTLEADYFQSLKFFKENQNYAEAFVMLWNTSREYFVIKRPSFRTVYLTHAPCRNYAIGKHDPKSLGEQVNFYFKSRDREDMLKELEFIREESRSNQPWHLFGHVAHDADRPIMWNNKIFMDTGAVHGGYLSAAIFNQRWVDFISEKSSNACDGGRISVVDRRSKTELALTANVKLSDEDEKTVRRVISGGARYVSGTMCPAPAKGNDIESLEAGLEVFKKAGIQTVILEPKYMGSRAQAYLSNKDPSTQFATSRNGLKIRVPGIDDALNELRERLNQKLTFETLVVDCELLPWHALGKGLIEGSFETYHVAAKETFSDLLNDPIAMSFDVFKKQSVEERVSLIEKFKEQLNLYGSPGKMNFAPFAFLEWDGEAVEQRGKDFITLSDDKHFIVDLTIVEGWDKQMEQVTAFYDTLTTVLGYEGVVIKPYEETPEGCVPYMKVRNKEYLRLIYGFDYTIKNDALCAQKNIKGKLRMSIDEYALGMAMIRESDPKKRNKYIEAMFGFIARERDLDPRL